MSGELVKWNGGEIEKPNSSAQKRRFVGEALALFRSTPLLPVSSHSTSQLVSGKPGVIVDLPRICAVHDRPYAARYIKGVDGLFHRGPMIEVSENLWLRQYAGSGGRRVIVPADDIVIAQETCSCCGACGFSAIRCGKCRYEICYGRTTGNFFRCRLSCGRQGTIRWMPRTSEGVMPREPRGGGYGV